MAGSSLLGTDQMFLPVMYITVFFGVALSEWKNRPACSLLTHE